MLPVIRQYLGKSQLSMLHTLLGLGLLVVVISAGLAACGSNVGGSVNPTPTTSTQVQKCGKVQTNPKGTPLDVTTAKQAEDCFWQAFQKCQPASFVYTLTGVDTITVRTFTIQNNGEKCAVLDAFQHSIVPQPLSTAKTYTCTGVTQKPDGLHFSFCGVDGDVAVPL